ncbi:MAG: hypothetical protein ABSC05_38805 [Candidatus Solibacter sp.]
MDPDDHGIDQNSGGFDGALQNILENFPISAALIGMEHISDHDLERYHLGMVIEGPELAQVEEHLLACPECVERAEQCAAYVDTLRAAIIAGDFDL